MRKNLVVVRAGDKSLHPQWLSSPNRNWDLAVSYYGDFSDRYRDQFDYFHSKKGSKWVGLLDFVTENKVLIDNYNYIWFPDDDLFTSADNINKFFDYCVQLDLTIAQPSLTPFSFYSWLITLQNPNFSTRITDFVEIMAPCFKVKDFDLFKNTFGENTSGWGYEWLWKAIAIKNDVFKFGIVDATPVFHTRPVGSQGSGGSLISPSVEMDNLKNKFNLVITNPKVISYC